VSSIAIVGAGPGLGLAVARRFGREGFGVALIARNADKLSAMVADLEADDIWAEPFIADVTEPEQLSLALKSATSRFGAIEVLAFSPADLTAPELAPTNALQTTPQSIQPWIDLQLFGGINACRAALPAMQEAGTGTILFTIGHGSVDPIPNLANICTAAAALRNWALSLAETVEPDGIFVGIVRLGAFMSNTHLPGRVTVPPSEVAEQLWRLHTRRDVHEVVLTGFADD